MSKVNFRCLTISANDGRREMDEEGRYRRVYWVQVQSDATGAVRRFRFFDSIHNEQIGKVGLSAMDLLEAFRCFVSDAQYGLGTFHEFCEELGYDEDSRASHSTWQACKATAVKYRALWTDGATATSDSLEDHMASVFDELSAMGVE